MRWAVLVAEAACGVESPPNVQPLPLPNIAYSLRVGEELPMRPTDRPTIYIDGLPATAIEHTYPPDVATYEHHVELRYQDQVLSALDMVNHPTDCCAPIGPKQHGDACTIVPDPAGAYDDCGAGQFCYQGTCHKLCVPGFVGNGLDATALPEGYPNDALLCD